MRKLFIIMLLIISIGTLNGCNSIKELDSNKLEKSIYEISEQSKDITIAVKEKDLTVETESVTLIFTNLSDEDYIYGAEPHLEVKIDDNWYVLPTLENVAWDEIAYILSPRDSREVIFLIKDNYGKLNEGEYRIIKNFYSDGEPTFATVEFKLDK